MFSRILMVWLCGLAPLSAAQAKPADVQGMPFHQRFTAADFRGDPYNGDLLTSDDGFVYLANLRGVLRFDGSRWDRLEMPGAAAAYAMRFGADGALYIGSYDAFGTLETDHAGEMHFRDLSVGFRSEDEPAKFGSAYDIGVTSRGVFIRSETTLFFVGYDGSRQQWPCDDSLRRLFVMRDQLHARIDQKGFSRFENGEFRLLPGGEQFTKSGIAEVLDDAAGPLVVGENGFFRVLADRIIHLPEADHEALRLHTPNAALRLGDDSVLVGAGTGDLLQFSPDLQLRTVYALGRHKILYVDRDRVGGVWVSTETELIRMQIPSPWSTYADADGLAGQAFDTAYVRGALWVATSSGVYRGRPRGGRLRFELKVPTELDAFALMEDGRNLLVIDNAGVLQHRGNDGADERIVKIDRAFDLKRSRFDKDQAFVLAGEQIVLLQRDPSGWRERSRWSLLEADMTNLIEVSETQFWIDDSRGNPQLWTWDPETALVSERQAFGAARGMQTDPAFGSALATLDGVIYVVSGRKVFRLDGEHFVPAADAPFSRVELPYTLTIVETDHGAFAYTERDLLWRPSAAEDWRSLHPAAAQEQGYSSLQTDADGKLRLVTWGGVLQYDPRIRQPPVAELHVQMRQALLVTSDGPRKDLLHGLGHEVVLSPDQVLQLRFGMASLESTPEVRYRVKSLIDSWSPWTVGEGELSLSYPGAGEFELEIEARTQAGRSADTLRLMIVAPPRWWQTPAAFILGIGLASMLITFPLVRRARKLQMLIGCD